MVNKHDGNELVFENRSESDIEITIMSVLHEADEPVGAVTLHFHLQDDLDLSQASIGRKLMEFDRRGLTERIGYKGRRLTPEGEDYLRDLIKTTAVARQSEAFLRTLNNSEGVKLIQVLEARRALEREIVRLAAKRITETDADELEALVENQRAAVEHGESGSYENLAFHEAIARISRNQVLAAALRLVRSQSQLTLSVAAIRERAGGILVRDHQLIVDALRTGDPLMAEQAMVNHIDKIIADVSRYFGIEESDLPY